MNRYKAFFIRQGIEQARYDIKLVSHNFKNPQDRRKQLLRIDPPTNRIAAKAYKRTVEREIWRTKEVRNAVQRVQDRMP